MVGIEKYYFFELKILFARSVTEKQNPTNAPIFIRFARRNSLSFWQDSLGY
jgi:hypothetical protein